MTSMLRRFTENELRSAAADADRVGQAPETLLRLGAELGLGVDAVPEAAGGLLDQRFSHVTRALRGFELGRGCAGLASLLECNVEPALALGRWGIQASRNESSQSLWPEPW